PLPVSACYSEAGPPPPARAGAHIRPKRSNVPEPTTRTIDDLMKALGLDGVSKSEVSWMCAEFDSRWIGHGEAPSTLYRRSRPTTSRKSGSGRPVACGIDRAGMATNRPQHVDSCRTARCHPAIADHLTSRRRPTTNARAARDDARRPSL